MYKSIAERIMANAIANGNKDLVMLAGEDDPEAAAAAAAAIDADADAAPPAETDPVETPVEENVEALQERNSELEAQVADGDLAVEISGDLAATDKIVIEIHNDDELIDDTLAAADDLNQDILVTEGFMKEGGMNAQAAEAHMNSMNRLGKRLGFKISTEVPSFQSFGGIGSRSDNTEMVLLEQDNWFKKVWNMVKGLLRSAVDNAQKLYNRLFDTATKTKARAESLVRMAVATKGTPSVEKIKVSSEEAAYGPANESIKATIEKVADATTRALAAAEKRAVEFNNNIIAALNRGFKVADAPKPAAMEEIKAPGGWGVVNKDGVATWERSGGPGVGGEVPVLSTGDIQAVAKAVLILCNNIIAAKETSGKNAQAYKDSLAAGESLEKKAAGDDSKLDRAAVTVGLKKLNVARACFTTPTNSILSYSAHAGAVALNIASRMLKTYKAPAKAPAKAEPDAQPATA